MLKLHPAVLCIIALGLSACGKKAANDGIADAGPPAKAVDAPATAAKLPETPKPKTPEVPQPQPQTPETPEVPQKNAGTSAAVPTLADGPDVCFRAVAKHLGADAKVSEISSSFSPGNAIDSNARAPEGQLTSCTVQYQNPEDPRKLLSASLNIATGEFEAPVPVELTVTGNAATFKLENYLIPLSKVNAAALSSVMEGQKAKLSTVYSRYAWDSIALMAPGAFDRVHTLRLDVRGRLAANDIKGNGYASVSVDGKKIIRNFLKP